MADLEREAERSGKTPSDLAEAAIREVVLERMGGGDKCLEATLDLDEGILKLLRLEADRRRMTVSAMLEDGIRLLLANCSVSDEERRKSLPPLPSFNSGGHLVKIDDRNELYRAMCGE